MNQIIKQIQTEFSDTPDLIIRNIKINISHQIYMVFLETLCSQDKINDYILKTLTDKHSLSSIPSNIPGGHLKTLNSPDEIEFYLYGGYTLLIDKNEIYAIETKADITRNVNTYEIESSIKGPKNGFVESFQVNLGLIKRRIRSHNLKVKNFNIGRLSNTPVGLLYVNDIVKPQLVKMVEEKLNNIDIDLINDVEDIAKLITSPSLFPTAITTERPDRCADALASGKIVILCDESPFALILPAFLIDFINPYADRYNKNSNINFTKIIRLICFFLSALTPAIYIALINYNQETIPTSLVINFALQRDGVPFPAIIECIIMLIICEILRESDFRFPSKYGSAISILGALILGDAAVNAGLVSPIMIIVASFTYISTLVFPELEIGNALRYYRFLFLFMAALFGLYGVLIAFIFFLLILTDTYSMGYPYTIPIIPFDNAYFKNVFIAFKNKKRSKNLSNNIRREK